MTEEIRVGTEELVYCSFAAPQNSRYEPTEIQ